MADAFINDDFLLPNRQARILYHEHAANLPIIDYHCHLSPALIAADHRFANITKAWLAGDHYKWRAMRTNGIPERLITGDASDREKFDAWARTVPATVRNPLYHWTHLELRRPFGIADRLLSPATAESIWKQCNDQLANDSLTARGIMKRMNVALVCTTDDPVDSLEHHRAIAADDSFDINVLPAWRPDPLRRTHHVAAWNDYIDQLARVADVDINAWDALLAAVRKRHEHFHNHGCRLSDHALDVVPDGDASEQLLRTIFNELRSGEMIDPDSAEAFDCALLVEFGRLDHQKNWTQQYHIGALRNNNSRMCRSLGPDTGFDCIDDAPIARPLARLLDRLDRENTLPRTILYNLNPAHNEVLAAMLGNFQDASSPGKLQLGSGWWFCDQLDGMTRQIEALSQLGLLSCFVGMLTDSRSFLSYPRHEYFRRLLCAILGRDMADGLIPDDIDLVSKYVRDISYHNAARYFNFPLSKADHTPTCQSPSNCNKDRPSPTDLKPKISRLPLG
jgi:glucuronate isomerase